MVGFAELISQEAQLYRDVKGEDWAKEAVLWCQANGIIQGTPNHYFN
nr:S-layer homology domain-containing protein [Fusibacter tunisiensis]